MRAGWIVSAVAVASVMVSCGPPPAPLTGTLKWFYGCDTSQPMQIDCGSNDNPVISGFTRATPEPPLEVACSIGSRPNGMKTFNVRIKALGSSQSGVSVCGDTSGSGVALDSHVTAWFRGAQITGITAAGNMGCDVAVDEITATSVRGRVRCRGVRDDSMNYRVIGGIGAGENMTSMADWADFSFTQCTVGAPPCR